eukprot:m.147108 g.147108  ORF g.147108 m.147108 type:complete len:56 (-) comp14160_c0_seq7:2432-2599(-)
MDELVTLQESTVHVNIIEEIHGTQAGDQHLPRCHQRQKQRTVCSATISLWSSCFG